MRTTTKTTKTKKRPRKPDADPLARYSGDRPSPTRHFANPDETVIEGIERAFNEGHKVIATSRFRMQPVASTRAAAELIRTGELYAFSVQIAGTEMPL